jgi:hypothetical protein
MDQYRFCIDRAVAAGLIANRLIGANAGTPLAISRLQRAPD